MAERWADDGGDDCRDEVEETRLRRQIGEFK
jgi:hypothetical protein